MEKVTKSKCYINDEFCRGKLVPCECEKDCDAFVCEEHVFNYGEKNTILECRYHAHHDCICTCCGLWFNPEDGDIDTYGGVDPFCDECIEKLIDFVDGHCGGTAKVREKCAMCCLAKNEDFSTLDCTNGALCNECYDAACLYVERFERYK